MALQPVRPGDLITAETINEIIRRLTALEQLVQQLDTRRVTITSVTPNPARSGQTVTVTGMNFEAEALNTVTLGGQPIRKFIGQVTPTRLAFVVPNLGAARVTTTLSIANNNGSAPFQVIVDPRVPVGNLAVSGDFSDLGVIEEEQNYSYRFLVTSLTDVEESYRFQIAFTSSVGVSVGRWKGALIGPDGSALTGPLLLPVEEELPIEVQLAVPARARRVTMTLSVRSVNSPNDSRLNYDFPVMIDVGEQQIANSGLVRFGAPTVDGDGARIANDGAIELPLNGGAALIESTLRYLRDGTYLTRFEYEPEDQALEFWQELDPLETSETARSENETELVGTNTASIGLDESGTRRWLVFHVQGVADEFEGLPQRDVDDRFRVLIRGYEP